MRDSSFPEMAARRSTPPPADLPNQNTPGQDQPPRAWVGPPADRADQQNGDQSGHQECDRSPELVEPGAMHIPGKQEHRAEGEDYLDHGLQRHESLPERQP